MSRHKAAIFNLLKDRMVYSEMEALGVDTSAEIAEINVELEKAKLRMGLVPIIENYQSKKRWLESELTDGQKKTIRDLKDLDPDAIACEVHG